jgi:hypothetical protein
MTPIPRNRIARHVRVRAGDLVPHELNPRTHPPAQRETLTDLYREVGFARSLLAFALPDGRLKLIDGHLRRDLTPDMELDVEVLDVSEEEARVLLLSLDPLVRLADVDIAALDKLRAMTATDSDALANLWASIHSSHEATEETLTRARAAKPPPEQFLILVECADEANQVSLLQRFQAEGLCCRALLS